MKHETFAPPEYKEGLEADAVCGQCGHVNPEGTLICKACGNNLRDQRMLRMAADQILDADNEPNERSVFMVRAGSVLAILFILWMGLNVGNITSMLTSAENSYESDGTATTNPGVFWTGASSATYDNMHSTLSGKLPSAGDAENARMNVMPANSLSAGNYVLFEQRGTGMRYTGAATIQIDGNIWRYTAALLDGIEIRGEASITEQILTSQWNQAGALYQGEYFAVTGTAEMRPDGSVILDGESNNSTQTFRAIAYPYSAL